MPDTGRGPAPAPSDDTLYSFAPNPARAEYLDARMHDELAASLSHLAEVTADTPGISAPLTEAAARIAGGLRVGPEAFGRYFHIAALLLEDLPDQVPPNLAPLTAATSMPRPPLTTLPRGGAGEVDTLLDLRMGEDAANFAPSTEAKAADLAERLAQGFALMQQALPDLHAELTAIIHRIVAAEGRKGAKTQFDGASHYQFWGLLLLNPAFHKTRLAIVEVLAHEASHSLLFGLTIDEPLVRNPDEDLFPSPLRIDPRPMDGIYHATYVSARMAWAMETLAASGVLSEAEKAEALEAARTDRANFAAGISVIDAHGDLSPTGAAIMQRARAWVEA
ncbi:aKG-HExxH-type peptide beta-hydroxylase [Vannielia litorea]|uniref:aKG-HExxH-type peptide beta-hydroxylase n=1 Tax=Vannielia litorea TaxID=1217970 RepID=UPI001BCDCA24|nr:HEXXH motif-containing putative peptide modification protein [Vannielia litorea]MBS8225831.1 HEXXH motif domain-containing protein [Vannielia litorea]